MDQSEFSVAGATENSNALVTVTIAVPFLPASPPVSSRLFFLAPVSLRFDRILSTDQEGTACSLAGQNKLPFPTGDDRFPTGDHCRLGINLSTDA